jgi:hypothetical protein
MFYVSLIVFTNVPYNLHMETPIYCITGLISIINVGLFIRNRKTIENFALNIEWDIDLSEFVIKMPKN